MLLCIQIPINYYISEFLVIVKDGVGRSGRVLLLMHLNVNISLNIYDRNTCDIPKNSSFPQLSNDTMYYCMLQDLN